MVKKESSPLPICPYLPTPVTRYRRRTHAGTAAEAVITCARMPARLAALASRPYALRRLVAGRHRLHRINVAVAHKRRLASGMPRRAKYLYRSRGAAQIHIRYASPLWLQLAYLRTAAAASGCGLGGVGLPHASASHRVIIVAEGAKQTWRSRRSLAPFFHNAALGAHLAGA